MAKKITPPREIAINNVDCRNIIESFAKGFQYNDAKIYPDKHLKTDVKYLSEDWVNEMLSEKQHLLDVATFSLGLLKYNSKMKINKKDKEIEALKILVEYYKSKAS